LTTRISFSPTFRCCVGTTRRIDLTYRQVLGFVGLYVGLWVLFGLAFFLFARRLTPLGWIRYLPVTGVYALAWVIGMVSVFAPAGIGVREGVLSILLAQYLPEPTAIVAALLSRLWITLAELVCALGWPGGYEARGRGNIFLI